jgi:hypothetical protein
VSVKRRKLRPLYDRLKDHCLRRIRVWSSDFGEEGDKPVVTKIEVQDVTPREKDEKMKPEGR